MIGNRSVLRVRSSAWCRLTDDRYDLQRNENRHSKLANLIRSNWLVDMVQPSPWLAVALLAALFSTALALGPALAHLFELPNKMQLEANAYFAAQRLYRGWALPAVVILAAQVVSMVATAILGRGDGLILAATLAAIAALLASQVIFWAWTYPANAATDQWTKMPENLQLLRRQWEYSHAGGAAFQLITMASISVAAVSPIWRGTAG